MPGRRVPAQNLRPGYCRPAGRARSNRMHERLRRRRVSQLRNRSRACGPPNDRIRTTRPKARSTQARAIATMYPLVVSVKVFRQRESKRRQTDTVTKIASKYVIDSGNVANGNRIGQGGVGEFLQSAHSIVWIDFFSVQPPARGTQDFEGERVFGAELILQRTSEPRRKCRRGAAGRDGNLKLSTFCDCGRYERTQLGNVDHIYLNSERPRLGRQFAMQFRIVGCAIYQRASADIAALIFASDVRDEPARRQ